MSDLSITISAEKPGDAQAIERLHERTFGPGRFVLSAYRLREHVDHLLELSFTAHIGTLLVGSVRQLPICVGDTKALMLGPLTVEPPFRKHGIGRMLMERSIADARVQGHRLTCWSVMPPIMRGSASSRCRRAARRCPGLSTTTGCW